MYITMTMEEFKELEKAKEQCKSLKNDIRMSDQGWRLYNNNLKTITKFFVENNIKSPDINISKELSDEFIKMVFKLLEDRILEEYIYKRKTLY